MADLYPTYSRQYQRPDSTAAPQYQLAGGSSISGIMYPPQLTAQTSVVDDQQQQQQQSSPIPNEGSNSPVSQPSSSPKQESPTAQKTDGMPQQPAKPQATFLTKLYAYVLPRVVCVCELIPAPPQSPRASRKPPHDSLGPGGRAHYRRATRAACTTCPPQRLPTIPFRQLLPATKRKPTLALLHISPRPPPDALLGGISDNDR